MSEENKYTLKQWSEIEGGHTMSDQYGVMNEAKELKFIQSLGEARMFKTRTQIQRQGARQITDHLFVSMLSLYAMSNDYKAAPEALKYTKRTNAYGNFNRPSPSVTDLYQTIFSLLKPDGLNDDPKDKLLLNKVKVDQRRIRTFMKQMEYGKTNPGSVQAFFYKIEKDLAIQDPKLKAARRLVGSWTNLTTNQQQLAATQLNRHFRLNARRSDLFPMFSNYANDKDLLLGRDDKKSIGKRIARGAAAFAAGYTAGKMTGM
jgi:hypothetical protein